MEVNHGPARFHFTKPSLVSFLPTARGASIIGGTGSGCAGGDSGSRRWALHRQRTKNNTSKNLYLAHDKYSPTLIKPSLGIW